jgi:hypothetical protein
MGRFCGCPPFSPKWEGREWAALLHKWTNAHPKNWGVNLGRNPC